MPSFEHEIIVELLRRRPQLVREMLADRGLALGESAVAELASIDMSQIAPAEYRCDAVVVFRRMLDAPVDEVVVFENQRSIDADKRVRWPVYVTVARSQHRAPTILVVFASDPAVARWAAAPIEIGHPGFVLRPIVIGLGDVREVTDRDAAHASPELAVLSVMAHPESAVVGAAALDAVDDLADDRRQLYLDVLLATIPRALLDTIQETYMQDRPRFSELARQNYQQGLEEGLQQARALLRTMLEMRFGSLSAQTAARIAAASLDDIRRFHERVQVADSIDAVLA